MKTLDQYIIEVKQELEKAIADVYRLEGALAMLQKQKAESEQEKEQK